jgi:hypothetical protein
VFGYQGIGKFGANIPKLLIPQLPNPDFPINQYPLLQYGNPVVRISGFGDWEIGGSGLLPNILIS